VSSSGNQFTSFCVFDLLFNSIFPRPSHHSHHHHHHHHGETSLVLSYTLLVVVVLCKPSWKCHYFLRMIWCTNSSSVCLQMILFAVRLLFFFHVCLSESRLPCPSSFTSSVNEMKKLYTKLNQISSVLMKPHTHYTV